MECKTCQTPLEGDYCHKCGQKVITQRLTVKSLIAHLFNIITNIEQGFTYTVIALFRQPGAVITNYTSGATRRYYHPLRYLLLMSGFAVLMSSTLDFEKILMQSSQFTGVELTKEALAFQKKTIELTIKYMSVVYVTLIPLMSLGSYFIFRRRGFNYAEHMVGNSYLYGQLSLVSLITTNLYRIPDWITIMSAVNFVVTLFISTWFYKTWFQLRWPRAILLTLVALFISYVFIGIASGAISLVWALKDIQ